MTRIHIQKLLLGLFGFILMLPIGLLLIYSLTDSDVIRHMITGIRTPGSGHRLIRFHFNWTSYIQIATESSKFAAAILNSWRYSLSSAVWQLLFALPAAVALSVLKAKGRGLIIPVYMIIMMMPFQVTMVPNFLTLYNLQLLNSPWAVIFPIVFHPFAVVMLYLFAVRIPRDLIESAQTDGASTLAMIRYVIVPLIKQGVWAVGLIVFIDTWNMIEQPLVFIYDMHLMPLSIFIRQSYESSPHDIFAAGVLFLLPVIILYGMYSRNIISGLQLTLAGIPMKKDGTGGRSE